MENNKEEKKDKLDSLVFKMLMSIVIISLPFIIFVIVGFEDAIVASITEIIFLLVANREDIKELESKVDKLLNK